MRVPSTAFGAVAALLLLAVQTIVSAGPPAYAGTAETGAWTAPFNIGITAVHAALLPNGKVLMVSRPRKDKPTAERLWSPSTKSTVAVSHPDPDRDLYCSGHSLLPNGKLFFTGGNRILGAKDGVRSTDVFAPTTSSWSPGPLLSEARWYPTNVTLPNGEVLVFGGQVNSATPSNTVDAYDPSTNTLARLPSSATRNVGLYPRLHALPSGKLFYSSVTTDPSSSVSQVFDPATDSWTAADALNFGPRGDGISILLPGLNKVLAFGGSKQEVGTATATAEIIDLSSANPQWNYTSSLHFARKEGNSVVLPDGTLLAVGGALGPGSYENPVKQTELFDPGSEAWTTMATQAAPRMHHSTALLLKDGRVLSAGGDRGIYQKTAEIYSPPYLFKGTRPVISSAPSAISYNQEFQITSGDAADVRRVALIRAPSVTHSMTFDQRYLTLPFTSSEGKLFVTGPGNRNQAPPGGYMMFILNSSGVPSVAVWVTVS